MALHKLALCDLQKKFTAGEVTAVEIVRAYALRIGQVESKVKAYVTQVKDAALQHEAERMAQNQAIDGHAAGHQGQPVHREGADHLRLTHAATVHSAVRCDGRR